MFTRRKKKAPKLSPQQASNNRGGNGGTSNVVQAVGQLKTSQQKLEKRVDFLRKKANRHLNLAKKANSEGKKSEAVMNLKRKKVFEKEIGTLEASIITIEENILRIEGSSAVADVYGVLQLARQTMQTVTRGMDAEKLDDIMADLQDLNADHDELQELLGAPVQDSLEDPDLLDELEALGADQLEESAFAGPTRREELKNLKELTQSARDLRELQDLVVPTSDPVIAPGQVKTDEDKELEALQAAMLA